MEKKKVYATAGGTTLAILALAGGITTSFAENSQTTSSSTATSSSSATISTSETTSDSGNDSAVGESSVLKAFDALVAKYPDANVTGFESGNNGEITFTADLAGQETELKVASNGTVTEPNDGEAADDQQAKNSSDTADQGLTATSIKAALDAVVNNYSDAQFTSLDVQDSGSYEVEISTGGKDTEVSIDQNGTVAVENEAKGEDKEKQDSENGSAENSSNDQGEQPDDASNSSN